ncbi:Ail/Lom family outer membrane beta-barrel protein [Salmonella enterica]|nr:Ail/Lom family outer membrane beta-barrel protein [Salmonella enterica]
MLIISNKNIVNNHEESSMKKLTVATLAGLTMLAGISSANAAAGDSTVSIGYAQFHSNGLKKSINGLKSELSEYYDPSDYNVDNYKDPKGFNVKYRYEFDDNWGVIGSFTYARSKMNGSVDYKDPDDGDVETGKGSLKANYYNIMVGPSYRINDYFSGYAMLGVASSKVKLSENYSYNYPLDGESGSGAGSKDQKDTALSYSVGFQINPIKNIAIDVAYEGAGHGSNGQVSGFNVGVGYSF